MVDGADGVRLPIALLPVVVDQYRINVLVPTHHQPTVELHVPVQTLNQSLVTLTVVWVGAMQSAWILSSFEHFINVGTKTCNANP